MNLKNRLTKVEQQQEELTDSQRASEIELLNKAKDYAYMAFCLLAKVSPGNVYDKERLEKVSTELCMAYLHNIPSLITERNSGEPDKPSHAEALCECYRFDEDDEGECEFDLEKFKAMPKDRQKIAREAIRLAKPEHLSSDEKRVRDGEF